MIQFDREFYNKLFMPGYPLKGFSAFITPEKPSYNSMDDDEYTLMRMATFVYESENYLRFTISRDSLLNTNVPNTKNNVFIILYDDLAMGRNNLVAMIIDPTEDLFDKTLFYDNKIYPNIIITVRFPESHKLVADIKPVTLDIIDLDDINNITYHWGTSNIGKDIVYDYEGKVKEAENILTDKQAGISKLREIYSFNDPRDLKGSMTITKSGLIQL